MAEPEYNWKRPYWGQPGFACPSCGGTYFYSTEGRLRCNKCGRDLNAPGMDYPIQQWAVMNEPEAGHLYNTEHWQPGDPNTQEIIEGVKPRFGNILDPIQSTLPPSVWSSPEAPEPSLRPKHAHFITNHIFGVLDKGGYSDPHQWLRLYLTGSLCTYQYSDASDADVSLFVDSVTLPEWSRAEMIGLMIEGCDGVSLPGTPYEIQGYVVPKGIHPIELFKQGLRAAYSIDDNRWVSPPDRSLVHNVKAQENGFYAYALEQADKMERLLRYEPDKAMDLYHQIHRRRMRDETAGKGEHSEANIVYKYLAHRGLLPALERKDRMTHAQFRSQAHRWHAQHRRTAAFHEPIPHHEARGNSRPVSMEEFQRLAEEGHQRYQGMMQNVRGTPGLDQSWESIKQRAHQAVLQPWGGVTINSATGQPIPDGADLYALTARPPGMPTIRIPENPSYPQFDQAMEEARARFGEILARESHHLGVFHDNDHHAVDIDPTIIVDNPHDVETIGAYTHNIGGAYHFASGNGYWPPHVASTPAEGAEADETLAA